MGVTGATVSGAVVTVPANATLTLTEYVTVKAGVTLSIPAGVTLTIQDDASSNYNEFQLRGGSALTVDGTLSAEPGLLGIGSGTDPIAISGSGTIQLSRVATASEDSYLLYINSGRTVTIANVTLQGVAGNTGELVLVSGSLTLTGTAKITGNESSETTGGGVYVSGSNGAFTMKDTSSVTANTSIQGGGVFVLNGTFTMEDNSTVKDNSVASGYGGGVHVSGNTGTFTMKDDSSVTGNTVTAGPGGGVYVANYGTFTMQDDARVGGSLPADANTSSQGGGVFLNGSSSAFTMSGHASVSGNNTVTAGDGGGVYNNYGTLTMNGNASIADNTAEEGGGVYNRGTFTLNDGSITNNIAINEPNWGNGGGVYNYDGTFTMAGGEISGNTTKLNGGGVYTRGAFIFTGGRIYSNIARGGYTSGDPTGNGRSLFINSAGTAKYSANADILGTGVTFTDADLTGR
jgi:hypothetical protein